MYPFVSRSLWSARFVAVLTAVSLLVSLLPMLASEALAAPTNLHTTASVTVDNSAEFVTPVIDASGHESLLLEFDFDATKLDATPIVDVMTYGWRSGAVDTVLGTFAGSSGENPAEIDVVAVSLPTGAQVADLQIYVTITANTPGPSDEVVITNLTVSGEPLPPPACAPQYDVAGPTMIENTSTGEFFNSIADAQADCDTTDGDTITLLGNLTTTEQITITRPMTLDGNGFSILPTFTKTTNSNNSALGVQSDDVTINNLTIDGVDGTDLHGINVYVATGIVINGTTVNNPKRTALVVNGAEVTVNNFTTSGSQWHAINAAPGSGVTTPTILTVNGVSVHAEELPVPHIYTDDISQDVTVTDTNGQYEVVYEGPNPNNGALTARAYRLADTNKPSLTITAPANNALVGTSFMVSGTASDAETSIVEVIYNVNEITALGGSFAGNFSSGTANGTSSWQYPVLNAPTGFYRVRARAFDEAGNFRIQYHDVEVDATKPSVTIISPEANEVLFGSDLTVTGTSSDSQSNISHVLYTVNEITALGGTYVASFANGTSTGTENWEFDVTGLTPGFYRVKVQAFDEFGNWRHQYHDIEISATPIASLTITAPAVDYDEVTGVYEFTAEYTDDDAVVDTIQWAVRAGTCTASTGTVAGNVDGFSDSASFIGTTFSTTLDTSSWTPGDYCLVVNPQEQAGETDLRETRWFTVPVPNQPTITFPAPEQVFPTTPILNEWIMATGTSFVPVSYQIAYNYDDGHTFGGTNTCSGQTFAGYTGFVGCRTVTDMSRNHTPSISEQGGVTIWVRAIDGDGDYSDWSEPVHYYYLVPDTEAPAIPTGLAWTDSEGDDVPNNGTTALVSGTASWAENTETDFSHYIYKYWNDIDGSPYQDETTAWTVSVAGISNTSRPGSFNQGEGTHYFCIAAVDTTGNESVCSEEFAITYETENGSGGPVVTPVTFGTLEVAKVVSGTMPTTASTTFSISVTCDDSEYNTTILLTDGATTALSIPDGVSCTVAEADTQGATVTYNPNETVTIIAEATSTVMVTNTFATPVVSGAAGGGGYEPRLLTTLPGPTEQVLGASDSALAPSCGLYIRDYLRQGMNNDAGEVMKLQVFLTAQGIYTPMTGFFGPITDQNVRIFQTQHSEDILAPWDLVEPTGYVFWTTRAKINNTICAGSESAPVL